MAELADANFGSSMLGNTGFNFTRRDGESIWWTSQDMNGSPACVLLYVMGPKQRRPTQQTLTQDGTAAWLVICIRTFNEYAR